jgi:NurA domain-containing protein
LEGECWGCYDCGNVWKNVKRNVICSLKVSRARYLHGELPKWYHAPAMSSFEIPDAVISATASQIHTKTNKDYQIPVVGVSENLETPQVFEIMPFTEIDHQESRFYAIDGSRNSHTFYNGVSLCFYQAGYVCFHRGKQIRLNQTDDPVVHGKVFHGDKMLVLSEKDLSEIYDEFLSLPPVAALITFWGDPPDEIFPYSKDLVIANAGTLLGFCQEVLEWACMFDIVQTAPTSAGDIILRDGPLRSLNIKQRYLTKLGYLLHSQKIRAVGITKQSPIKTELAYTYSKIDVYLQSKLRPNFAFRARDPKSQKLCCFFEVRDDVLESAYQGSGSSMYAKKDVQGGRGFGLFFTARLDYVEKLQNYDWVVCDLNIYDCVPRIAHKNAERDAKTIADSFYALTATSQEHYILGYPYPLVEAHNLVTLTGDFKQQVIARVKAALYSSQHMDHTDIENLFLDLHSRF